MRNAVVIILAVIVLLLLGSYADYKKDVVNPTPTPTPTSSFTSTITPTSFSVKEEEIVLQKQPDATIGPGESAIVQCGEDNAGTRVIFNKGSFVSNIGLGEQTDITARVQDEKGQPAGGLVEWRLYYRGTLQVDGCNATFVAPNSIGTAYSTSASINARVVPSITPTPPTSLGEGGPVNAGFVTTTKVTILSGAKPTCYDPEGVSVSINSVDTTRNVQIVIDTPAVVGRVFNGRVATVRDGPGTYYIEYHVDGALYDATTSQVGKCRLEVVRR